MGVIFLVGTEFLFCKMKKFWSWVAKLVNMLYTPELYT